ncbi:MAG: response regulator [candidate division FCPU426 bacterium]
MEPLKVLVVDDSSSMRAILKKILRLTGLPLAQIFEAGNGLQALELLAQNAIDLVFVDLNMPEMGGMEFIGRVQSDPKLANTIPIIVVSTESSQTRIDEILAKGMGFIHKPFTPEQVCEKVRTVMGGASHGSE